MIEGNFLNQATGVDTNEITFPDIQGTVLEIAVQYMYHKVKHAKSLREPPQFEPPSHLLVEVLLAANYLGL